MRVSGLGLSRRALHRQLMALPCDKYLIRLVHHSSHKTFPGQRLWTAGQLLGEPTVGFLRARNRDGYDVYFRPHAGDQNAGYVLLDLDEAAPAIVQCMRANGHAPCVVIETSVGHRQAWIQVSRDPLPVPVATAVAQRLAHLYHADRASAEGCHLGRLAGFTNQKMQRRLAPSLPPWVKVQHAAPQLASQGAALVADARRAPAPARLGGIASTAGHPRCPEPQAAVIYRSWLHRLRIPSRFPQPDWSIADLWIARELRRQRTPLAQAKLILQEGSPQFPRRHADPEDYLRRTLACAGYPLGCAPFPARQGRPAEGHGGAGAPGWGP